MNARVPYPLPHDEADRLQRVEALGLGREARFERLTRLVCDHFGLPMAALTLVAEDELWVKSVLGFEGTSTSRAASICAHVIVEDNVLVIEDVHADPRFGLVRQEHPTVRFYAGAPIGGGEGRSAIGSLCVAGTSPQGFTEAQRLALTDFARLAEELLLGMPDSELNAQLRKQIAREARARKELEGRTARLRILKDIAVLSAGNRAPMQVVREALTLVAQFSPNTRASWSSLESNGRYSTLVSCGPAHMKITEGLSGDLNCAPDHLAALRSGRAVVTPDVRQNPTMAALVPAWQALDVLASVELIVESSPGHSWVVCLDAAEPRDWAPDFVAIIDEVAHQLALVLREVEARDRRAEAKRELRAANARLSAVLNSQATAVLVEDEARNVVLVNDAFVKMLKVDISPAEAIGRPALEVFRPAARKLAPPEFFDLADRRVAERKHVSAELVRGIEHRIFERDFVPIEVDGRAAGHMWQYREVTGRVHEYEQLEAARNAALEASLAKSAFLATISHEIRTPLNGVMGTLSLLHDQPLAPQGQQLVSTALESADLLLRLLNDILDASKMEAGKLTLEAAPFDPREAVKSIAALFESPARARGLSLKTTLSDEVPARVVGDGHRFKQVLTNLVSNAVKFTEVGGVAITLEWVQRRLRVTVEDSGPGIPAANRERLFEKFRQGDASTTRRFGGTGLGLSISAELAELMGGALRLVPSAIGTRFEVELPLPCAGASHEPRPTTQHLRFPGMRVLVVDDNAVNRMVAVAHLKKLGCEVDEALDGLEAVTKVATALEPFHVVFMDCHMPVLDGFAATRQLRELFDLSQLAIVALTASALEEDLQRCHACGMDSVLTKPVRRDDFVSTLTRIASQREQR